MRRADFSYSLPQELIADRPLPRRGASRLLALDGATGRSVTSPSTTSGALLNPGDLVVLNDTRVLPARLAGRKSTGGVCELLLERILDGRRILAQARSSKALKPGIAIALPGGASALAIARRGDLHELELDREALPYFDAHGSVPLPPYLAREAEESDRDRYQTVYAEVPGAVAAPTAGLHFDRESLAALGRRGIGVERVTLHVGAGTFTPMRVENLADHRMHAERIHVPAATVAAVECRAPAREPHHRCRHYRRTGARVRGLRRPAGGVCR